MSEKRFFEIDYDGIYYVVDSSKLKRKKNDFDDEEDFEQYCLGNAVIQIVNLLNEQQDTISVLKEENKQLKIVNAKWLDKSLQDKQIRYNNANHKELTRKYLQLKNENEQLKRQNKQLRKQLDNWNKLGGSIIIDIDALVKCLEKQEALLTEEEIEECGDPTTLERHVKNKKSE